MSNDMQDLFGPGPSTRMPGFPDMLPTHPAQVRAETMHDQYDFRVRVDQFDLSDDKAKAQYEQILTDIIYGKKMARQEKWSSDKDGQVTIAMSWIDLIPKKKKRSANNNRGKSAGSGRASGERRGPGPVHGSNPGLPEGAYPGQGAVIVDGQVVRGADQAKETAPEGADSFDDM